MDDTKSEERGEMNQSDKGNFHVFELKSLNITSRLSCNV